MKNIGIMDGDLLAVHSTKSANEGDIIVARIDDEVTVKRLKFDKEKHLVYLMAENEDYQPIKVDLREQEFFIEGISVGVIRRNH
jgi:repressor LexA